MSNPIIPQNIQSPGMEDGRKDLKRKPWLLKYRSSQSVILMTVSAAAFTDGFIYAVIVPVLPFALRDRYHVPSSQVQLWTSLLLGIFGAVVLVGSPFVGWIADMSSSRKPVYTFGLVSLALGVLAQVITTHLWMLILSRVLQGAASAIVYTIGLTLISDTVASKDIGYYMGFAISAMSFGVLVGPSIGGIVFDWMGYYAVVGTMAAVAVVDTVLRVFMIERHEARLYIEEGSEEPTERTRLLSFPPSSPEVLPVHDNNGKIPEPSQPTGFQTFTLLANPQIASAIYGVFVQTSVCAAFDGVLTLFLEEIFGWRGWDVAVCFLLISIPLTFLGPIAGKLSDTYGPKWIAVNGFMLSAVPLVLFQWVERDEKSQIWLLYGICILLGATLSLIVSPLAADISNILEESEKKNGGEKGAYAQSYGLFNCAMAAATLFGPNLAGWLKEAYGWTAMCWALAVFSISGAIPVFLYTGR